MRRKILGAAFAAWAFAAAPAGAQPDAGVDCDPEVARALEDAAVRGVEQDQIVIRHPEEGIGDPDSVFDMTCDLFDFPTWDALVRLPSLPDLFDELCDAAKDAWRNAVTRPFDRSIYALDRRLDVLPGLGVDVRPRSRRIEGGGANPGEVLRGIVGGRDS